MEIVINIILPIFIAVIFIAFLIYQVFKNYKVQKNNKSVLYAAHSSNKGVPADQVFKMLQENSIELHYLGYNKKDN